MTESLRALLTNLIDYAGLYPPASLPLQKVVENYQHYLGSPECWILNRLVLPATKLREVELGEEWRVTLLVDSDPGPLPPEVETLETKCAEKLSLPTFYEAPIEQITHGLAKIRTGGVTPDAIPDSKELAAFLVQASAARMPFKATAGLHHPVRCETALTYAADSPRAVTHGFINVFVAAAFAWHGADGAILIEILDETEPANFQFDDHGLKWRTHSLTTAQIAEARYDFAGSFGSCSFEEPIASLRKLKWLP